MSKHSPKETLNSESEVDEDQFEIIELKETMAEGKNVGEGGGSGSNKKDVIDGAMANTPRPGQTAIHLDKGQEMSVNNGDVHIEVAETGIANAMANNQGQSDNGGIPETPDAPSRPTPVKGITAGDVKKLMTRVSVAAGPWADGTLSGIIYALQGLRFLFLKDRLSLFNILPAVAIIVGIVEYADRGYFGEKATILISLGVVQLTQGILARLVHSQNVQPDSAGANFAPKICKVLNTVFTIALMVCLFLATVIAIYGSSSTAPRAYFCIYTFVVADIIVFGSLALAKIFL